MNAVLSDASQKRFVVSSARMIALRRFADVDVPFGMLLKTQAGWNQLPADWARLLALQPDGGFVAEYDGRPAGVVLTTLFGPVAWVSMMLVEQSLRGRGIGRRLMDAAIAFAEQRGARSIRLDATPLGQPLYERLGFQPDFTLMRYAGRPQPIGDATELPAIAAELAATLDQRVTGTDRGRLWSLLEREQPLRGILDAGSLRGFYGVRRGSLAVQIGPCLAGEQAGPRLLRSACQQFAGEPVLLDIPEGHAAAAQCAVQHGLSPQRPLLRMTRGERTLERLDWLWASFGPEKG